MSDERKDEFNEEQQNTPEPGKGENRFFGGENSKGDGKFDLIEFARSVLVTLGIRKGSAKDENIEAPDLDEDEEIETPEKKQAKAMMPIVIAIAGVLGFFLIAKQFMHTGGPSAQQGATAPAPDSGSVSLFGNEFKPDVANLESQLMDQKALTRKLKELEKRFDAKIANVKKENEKLKKENEKLKKKLAQGGAAGPVPLNEMPPIPGGETAGNTPQNVGAPQPPQQQEVVPSPQNIPGIDPLADQTANLQQRMNNDKIPMEEPYEFANRINSNAPLPTASGTPLEPSQQKIFVYSPVKDVVKGGAKAAGNAAAAGGAGKKKEPIAVIPAATIGDAILLNGVDAPTGPGARKDPIPVVMQFVTDGHTASYFNNIPVKGCRLIASGSGDMASERAYFLSERIICVADDGRTFSAKADGYVLGEDGKVGIRGRLVSKQGEMIAKSFLAGLLQGFGNVLSANASTTSISPLTGVSTVSPIRGNDLARAGIGGGLGEASKRIADFYMHLAESVFPVIEVDAGRRVEVVFTHDLKFLPVSELKGADGNGYWDIPFDGGKS